MKENNCYGFQTQGSGFLGGHVNLCATIPAEVQCSNIFDKKKNSSAKLVGLGMT